MEAARAAETGWSWIDIQPHDGELEAVIPEIEWLHLDSLALHDTVNDIDLPKVDDFGSHLLVVLHGLRSDIIDTYEIDIFITDRQLVTFHEHPSPSVDALWAQVQKTTDPDVTPDVLAARLCDVLSRRILSVGDVFDIQYETLISAALRPAPDFLEDHEQVRAEISRVRRVVHPQREVLDQLRRDESTLVSDAGRRLFSDAFDVANRAANALDNARSALSETLEAYRGAEARAATEVTKVLTVYAAILLPLSLIVGFFGMNHRNLPGVDSDSGWIIVSVVMAVFAIGSLLVFRAVGWLGAPGSKRSISTGLSEALRVPVKVIEVPARRLAGAFRSLTSANR